MPPAPQPTPRVPTIEPLETRRLFAAGPVPLGATVTDTTGPRVVREQLIGPNKAVTQIVLTFSESLDPATAQDVRAYAVSRTRHIENDDDDEGGGFFDSPIGGGGDGGGTDTVFRRLRFESAVYDDAAKTVTITTNNAFNAEKRFRRLRVNGTGERAIRDVAGNRLDPAEDRHNGNALIRFNPQKGKRLTLKDADGDRLSLRVKGPGKMVTLVHKKNAPDPLIFLEETRADRTVIDGTVKQGNNGDGAFDIAQIVGTSSAQLPFLTDPAFRIAMTQA